MAEIQRERRVERLFMEAPNIQPEPRTGTELLTSINL